jgi:hypothetical protein
MWLMPSTLKPRDACALAASPEAYASAASATDLAELAAADFAAVEVLDKIGDELFHTESSLCLLTGGSRTAPPIIEASTPRLGTILLHGYVLG